MDTILEAPGDFIRNELERRGWGQDDLARIIGRPAPRINELIRGKIGISPELAIELAAALGGTAEEWLQREFSPCPILAMLPTKRIHRLSALFLVLVFR